MTLKYIFLKSQGNQTLLLRFVIFFGLSPAPGLVGYYVGTHDRREKTSQE